jgi:hypothetical protein
MTFALILLISVVAAANPILLCWKEGETVYFSECNSGIRDYTCENSMGCKQCVTNPRTDVYCPANINLCNSGDLECTYLSTPIDEGGINTDNTDDTNTDNTNENTDNDNTHQNNDDSSVRTFNLATGLSNEGAGNDDQTQQKDPIGKSEVGAITKKSVNNNLKFIAGFLSLLMILEAVILFFLIKKLSVKKEKLKNPEVVENQEIHNEEITDKKIQKKSNKKDKMSKVNVKTE